MKTYKIKADHVKKFELELELARLSEKNSKTFNKVESSEDLSLKEANTCNYPCNPYNSILSEALSAIFNSSSHIHADILISMVKDIILIDIDEIIKNKSTNEERMEAYCTAIIEIIIINMEMLYYFYEDDLFSQLIFDLCIKLDLNLVDYGFTKFEKMEDDSALDRN